LPDPYEIELRRIANADAGTAFTTGDNAFDTANPSGTLQEYVARDEVDGGEFKVYLLIETTTGQVSGLASVRYELDGAQIPNALVAEQPAIYLSRIGIIQPRQHTGLGHLLLRFQYFIYRSEVRNHGIAIWVYWKTRANLTPFFEGTGAEVIHEYYDPTWGRSVIMAHRIEPRIGG